jgi:hypothetical protein
MNDEKLDEIEFHTSHLSIWGDVYRPIKQDVFPELIRLARIGMAASGEGWRPHCERPLQWDDPKPEMTADEAARPMGLPDILDQ